jgi:hypothetical protein
VGIYKTKNMNALINDIASGKIDLKTAMTKAKIISHRLKNDTFQNWIKKELEGYQNNADLPDYRKIYGEITMVVTRPYMGEEHIKFDTSGFKDKEFSKVVNTYYAVDSISTIESNLRNLSSHTLTVLLPSSLIPEITSHYRNHLQKHGASILKAYRTMSRAHYENILDQTKQKLLDTLLDLNSEVPNLSEENFIAPDSPMKVQHIVTNNIYGSNNPVNMPVGNNDSFITQSVSIVIHEVDESKLRDLGVTEPLIEELKNIIEAKKEDKLGRTKAIMNWLGSVSSSLVASGLSENYQQVVEFIQGFI